MSNINPIASFHSFLPSVYHRSREQERKTNLIPARSIPRPEESSLLTIYDAVTDRLFPELAGLSLIFFVVIKEKKIKEQSQGGLGLEQPQWV
jgi:hypothetical protein